jgi:glycosyltransferase involved in cell wall biosynthesis
MPRAAGAADYARAVRVDVVDPSAYTPPYDHALCSALARAGTEVRLQTSHFGYGPVPPPDGYERVEHFYRCGAGAAPGSPRRFAAKIAQQVPDMLRYARSAAPQADVVHFQWLTVQPVDVHLLPRGRPLVLTAHDVLPREPRRGQLAAQRRLYERVDAVVVHSEHGRARLVEALGIAPEKVHVIAHGAFEHLTHVAGERPLPDELAAVTKPVVLCFGLLRPYKGIDVLLDAWRAAGLDAELWIAGMPRMDIAALRAAAPPSVRWITRFIPDEEVAGYFRRADLVALPYREIDQSGVLFTALAFGRPLLLSAVGGFPEVAGHGAGALVAPGDPLALAQQLRHLMGDDDARARLAAGARAAAAGPYSWDAIAAAHLELYGSLTAARARRE